MNFNKYLKLKNKCAKNKFINKNDKALAITYLLSKTFEFKSRN